MTEDCSLRGWRWGGQAEGLAQKAVPARWARTGCPQSPSVVPKQAPPGSPGLSGAVCAKLGYTSSDGVPAASRFLSGADGTSMHPPTRGLAGCLDFPLA